MPCRAAAGLLAPSAGGCLCVLVRLPPRAAAPTLATVVPKAGPARRDAAPPRLPDRVLPRGVPRFLRRGASAKHAATSPAVRPLRTGVRLQPPPRPIQLRSASICSGRSTLRACRALALLMLYAAITNSRSAWFSRGRRAQPVVRRLSNAPVWNR
jgi:hypothetical protein